MTKKFTFLIILFCCGFTFRNLAQDLPKTEKSIKQRDNLFHPTPKDSLRDMDPDRPNITESPYTVDAGHIQYEADFMRYQFTKTTESRERALLYNYLNFKLGLTSSMDLQVLVQTYARQHTLDFATREKTTDSGFGDLTLRLKKNFLGDDGNVSLAVIPYLPPFLHQDQQKWKPEYFVP